MEKVVISLLNVEEAISAGITRAKLVSGKPVAVRGKLFLRVGDRVYCCPDTNEGRKLLISLEVKPKEPGLPRNETELYRQVLENGTDSLPEGTPLFGAPPICLRCVIVFRLIPDARLGFLPDSLKELAPLETKDIFIQMQKEESALIRMTESQDIDEIVEYASALCETVQSETGLRLCAGIGSNVQKLCELGRSCREAREALEIGRKMFPEESVYVYGQLILERFLTGIPKELIGKYRDEVFRGQVLPRELLETVEMFFRCDLNLSVTAKKMYIHRNTLTYRLDKIQRLTGLDLRKIRDALVFRLLTALPDDAGRKG